MATGRYHHGDLRNALLDAVGELIDASGIGAVGLRETARRAGVSHSAPAHHFGDKLGMLTAFATRGHERLRDALVAAFEETADEGAAAQYRAIGYGYLRFAVTERAYFDVMFRGEMHDGRDPSIQKISHQSFAVLARAVAAMDPEELGGADRRREAIRAWATMHGLATLWLDGAIQQFTDDDLEAIAETAFQVKGTGH